MNTKRGHDDGFRGAQVHLHLHTPARDYTTLANTVLRGQFRRPDKTLVRLKAGPRAALYALLSYGVDHTDPAWRLDMDLFTDLFVESKATVYGWIRTLESAGFVTRERVNDPETGRFKWRMDVSDSPAALATVTPVNPQVAPIHGFSGDGAAPPVDNSKNRRSHHTVVSPVWEKPSMENPHKDTSYRETSSSYLPASSSEGDTRENEAGAERPFAVTGPPRLVSPTSMPTEDEQRLTPHERWKKFVSALINAPQCRGKLMPSRQAQELIAIRAQVAAERLGWTDDQLRNLLLAGLAKVDFLAGVWLWRLHPEHVPQTPGRQLDPELHGRGDEVPPSATRRDEIRKLAGVERGARWNTLMGGGAG